MKIVRRRSMYHEEDGMACGPTGITAIDAELVVDDNGRKIYLHAQWVDEVPDTIVYEATFESTYDVCKKLNSGKGSFDDLIAERDRITAAGIEDDARFEPYYARLKQMILAKMEEHDIEPEFDDEDEEEATIVAALFEIGGWSGLDRYLFTGESAEAILVKLNQVQDLECLMRMGEMFGDPLAAEAAPKLAEILEKCQFGELTLQDLEGLSIKLSVGGLRCTAIAEGEKAVAALKAANRKAHVL